MTETVCSRPRTAILPVFLLLAAVALPASSRAETPVFPGVEKVIQPSILERFEAGEERVGVIVLLTGHRDLKGKVPADDPAALAEFQRGITSGQEAVLNRLDDSVFELRFVFENILAFSGNATYEGLRLLTAMDEVELVQENFWLEPHTRQGVPLMHAEAVRDNYDGSGVSVAVTDSGIDYNHSRLGDASFPNAKVIGGYDFGDNDSDPLDQNGHGTGAAGIVAGDTGGGGHVDFIGGVAHGAKLYALKVSQGSGGGAPSDVIARSWDWAVTHKNDDPNNPILVINTSMGGGKYTQICDAWDPLSANAASNAVAAGITLFVSSGNDAFCDSISTPACVSDTISVGAVYDAPIGSGYTYCVDDRSCIGNSNTGCPPLDWSCTDDFTAADQVTCYSNTADWLDILAPSNEAISTAPNNQWQAFGGTSAAAPYASGAAALLQSYAKAKGWDFYTPAEIKQILQDNGVLVTDTKPPADPPTIPRVDLEILGNSEICGDNIDNNGDLKVDIEDPDCCTDADGDTAPAPPCIPGDCDDNDDTRSPTFTEACSNLIDDDCDTLADCDDIQDCALDADGDTYAPDPCGGDCDESDPSSNPGAEEVCGDGRDNDCDTLPDCQDDFCNTDWDGDTYTACDGDCDETDDQRHPGVAEACDDTIDNDCDGSPDCSDLDCLFDGDGDTFFGEPCGQDCDDSDENNNPGELESCGDGQDNDCDGNTDCDDLDCISDLDGDTHLPVPCGEDCDDWDENNFGGNQEDCGDGQDNECDLAVDCDDSDCLVDIDLDTHVDAPCGDDCDDLDEFNFPGNDENCGDGGDNDCDTVVDCDDTDCRWRDRDADGKIVAPCGDDCNDNDIGSYAVPGPVTALTWSGKSDLTWDDLASACGDGVVYQVVQGRVSDLPAGGPNETCLVQDASPNTFADPTTTTTGDLFYYLVRAQNGCTTGEEGYGADSTGADRVSTVCN